MTLQERQKIINDLSHIGYYGGAEIKDSVFLTIAAMYSVSDDIARDIGKHVSEVISQKTSWNKELFRELI